ncbi:DUF4097 family beta strand repeat-containing protein [Shewanella sp. NIFS-20-20]|uniref:DUF4097 family beta strand repeat-containing protein n=1 Tax=Shewanella sp. NIFS-20-20 TaxID=2853806 RepID=UPI001C47B794|nr:DUF4097 family beta strand repeat-containing protein [Shewanella sp. NIFS-20-20]MBV7315972.1 DUF4097 domain-containing protein [Shewanella sp. NIFS-20-20]
MNESISIRVLRGEVRVEGWDQAAIAVTGQLDSLSEGFIFEKSGNTWHIEDKIPHRFQSDDCEGSQLVIRVPRQLTLQLYSISSNQHLTQLTGTIHSKNTRGSIHANQLSGNIHLQTTSGDIYSDALSGEVQLRSVSGNSIDRHSQGQIMINSVSGNIDSDTEATTLAIATTSGNSKINADMAQTIDFSSVSGDSHWQVSASLTQGEMTSTSGDINLYFSAMPALTIAVKARGSARLINQLTQESQQGKHTILELGNRGELTIESTSGTIKLQHATSHE